MNIKSHIGAVCACLAVVSLNANAANYPWPVEYDVTGSIDIIDTSGFHIGEVPVDFTSPVGDFDFTYLGNPGVGHDTTLYNAPGTYDFIFNSDPLFPNTPASMTVGVGQIGMRTFIDWNFNTYDILTVWDVTTSGNIYTLMATDMEGDGHRGYLMPNGPFAGLNFVMDVTVVTPIPAAAWLFGSGLIALLGVAKRRARV